MAVLNATTNFGFRHLEGTDDATYNSINALVTDIDTELYAKVAIPGMVMLFQGTIGAGSTWEALSGAALTAVETSIGSAPAGFQWIKKKA